MPEEYKDHVQRLLFCVSASNKRATSRFKYVFGEAIVGLSHYFGRQPPRILQYYWDSGLGYIGEEDSEDTLKLYRVVINETCLEIIRDYNWTPSLIWGKWRDEAEKQSSIGYIYLVNLDDRTTVNEAIETMSLVPDYPFVVAVEKSDIKHNWHENYDILNSPETLTYDLDDVESVADVYRALVRKMPIDDTDKQGFLDCIDWQVEHNDR